MSKKIKSTTNSMAPTEKDMVKLGEEMKQMDTNSEVIEKGLVPDPIQ